MKTITRPFITLLLVAGIVTSIAQDSFNPFREGVGELPGRLLRGIDVPAQVDSSLRFTGPAVPISTPLTTQNVIRDTKLAVLKKHYEETFTEVARLEKDMIGADSKRQTEIVQQVRALGVYLSKVEADIAALMFRFTAEKPRTADEKKEPKSTGGEHSFRPRSQ